MVETRPAGETATFTVAPATTTTCRVEHHGPEGRDGASATFARGVVDRT